MKDDISGKKKKPAVQLGAVELGWEPVYDQLTMSMVYSGDYKVNKLTFRGRIVVSESECNGRIIRNIERFIFNPPCSWLRFDELNIANKDYVGTLRISPTQKGEWYQIEYGRRVMNTFDTTPLVKDAILSTENDLKIVLSAKVMELA